MKKNPYILLILSLLGSLLPSLHAAQPPAANSSQPNVVLLISDDQTWDDYGFMGHPHVATPHLDKLASESLLYERGYVSAPLCRPSLASLVTGLHPHQHNIRGNDPILPGNVHRIHAPELFVEWRPKMSAPIEKLPSMVKELEAHGYLTLQTGKWWEGDPLEHGFTDAMTHGITEKRGRHGDVGLEIGRTTQQPYYDFVDKAIEQDKPFFVWYGIFLPHTPHNAREELYLKYKDVASSESEARYWANIEWFDEACGEVIDYLETKGIADNTIIIYTCDNGWVSNPEQPGRSIRSKREPFEDGIRTPIMIRHTGKVAPARNQTTLASNIDIAPTILQACGIEVPAIMAGLDLRQPELLDQRNQIVVEDYAHDIELSKLDDLNSNLESRVLIEGWDKIIAWPDRTELYNLKSDPDDLHDLAGTHPEKATELSRKLSDWLRTTPKPHLN
ncbi:sulfatase-like hydrolase/transferase [Pelagicoccus sp. SDUM812005]|uniref:sulfatase-like hydrolase/transferase n=1 Tax=Pelagicoccus sp. SDUM812005 TaxID=3041257 RepID=UPI00280DE8B9|nr:sulfatase-like hydrolase/transferase [Pelagicoccus sp. SDUM812005]MDQ8183601.1 sulfatase-like hydrolase/transferase [Pelagicoccus sp. SDUM812005]